MVERKSGAAASSMKSLTEHLWFEVPNRRGFVNITDVVERLVQKSGVKEGLCLVNAMHITRLGLSSGQTCHRNPLLLNCLQIFSKRQRSCEISESPHNWQSNGCFFSIGMGL